MYLPILLHTRTSRMGSTPTRSFPPSSVTRSGSPQTADKARLSGWLGTNRTQYKHLEPCNWFRKEGEPGGNGGRAFLCPPLLEYSDSPRCNITRGVGTYAAWSIGSHHVSRNAPNRWLVLWTRQGQPRLYNSIALLIPITVPPLLPWKQDISLSYVFVFEADTNWITFYQ